MSGGILQKSYKYFFNVDVKLTRVSLVLTNITISIIKKESNTNLQITKTQDKQYDGFSFNLQDISTVELKR